MPDVSRKQRDFCNSDKIAKHGHRCAALELTCVDGRQRRTLVSAMFLAGAGSQVFGALINKISNWYVYRGANDSAYREKRRYRFCKWLVHQFWLDITLDLITVGAFGIAVWHLLNVFSSG